MKRRNCFWWDLDGKKILLLAKIAVTGLMDKDVVTQVPGEDLPSKVGVCWRSRLADSSSVHKGLRLRSQKHKNRFYNDTAKFFGKS